MKKVLVVLAFASVSLVSMAQENETPTLDYSVATNSFWSNWFVQAGIDWNAWYAASGNTENGLSHSPFKKFRSNPGLSLAVGKWFTPGMGVRLKGQGIWGKRATDGDNAGNGNKYWVLNAQALFNLSNMLKGYDPDRTWSVIPFFGGGLGRTMTYNFYGMDLSIGLINSFKLSDKVNLNVELGWNRFEGDIDGDGRLQPGPRGWDSHDNNVYAELGLSFNLGKGTWNKVPDVDAINALNQAELDALNARLNGANDEIDRLKKLLADCEAKPTETIITESAKEFITTPISVFFDINRINVANLKDLVNVKALAKYAIENDSKILVTGYADSATGTPAINERLSLKRADTVLEELVKMGVKRENITTAHNGGVNILGVDSPISFDRRATVQITE